MGRYQLRVGRNTDLLSSIHRTGRIFQNSPYRIAKEVNITHNHCQPRSQCRCSNLKQHIRNNTIGAQIARLTTRGSSILVGFKVVNLMSIWQVIQNLIQERVLSDMKREKLNCW
jgi:hypothetical protein